MFVTGTKKTRNVFLVSGLAVLMALFVISAARSTYPELDHMQRRQEMLVPLDVEHSVGQTVEAGKCAGVTYKFSLKTGENIWETLDSWLTVEVRPAVDALDQPLVLRRYPLFFLNFTQQLAISIPGETSILDNGCYIFFQSDAVSGELGLYASRSDAYSGGMLIQDGNPQDEDLTFASYRRLYAGEVARRVASIAPQWMQALGMTLVYAVLGWALLTLVGQRQNDLLNSLFAGMALFMICMAVFSIVGVSFRKAGLWASFAVILGSALVKIGLGRMKSEKLGLHKERMTVAFSGSDMMLAAAFLLALLVKFMQTSDLPAPSWVDAFFHAYVLHGFEESGNIPLDLNYPFGFHVLAYVNGLLSGWNNPEGLLFTGQWLSALSGLAVNRLAETILRRKDAAFMGAVLLWFVAPFPSYLTNWSRFPLLLGMVFVCNVWAWALKRDRRDWPYWIFLGMIVLALAMSHYASLVLMMVVVLVIWIMEGSGPFFNERKSFWKKFLLMVKSLGWPWGVLLFLPAVIFLISRLFNLYIEGAWVDILAENRNIIEDVNLRYYLRLAFQGSGSIFWMISAAGVGWLFRKSRQDFKSLFGWMPLMALVIAGQLILLGGSFPGLNNLLVWIFIPFSIVGGYALVEWMERTAEIFPQRGRIFAFVLGVSFAAFGAWSNIGFLNPLTVLADQGDQVALEWARDHLPAGSDFLINAFVWGRDYQPSDGGGWLPYWGTFETHFPETDEERNNMAEYISENHIQYYFQGQGEAWFLGEEMEQMLQSGQLLFDQEGVRIYQFD